MLALVGGEPKVLNLRQLLESFIQHRHQVITRRTEFELKKAEECLDALVKERQIRGGDFWGINVTARRYDNVFDPRNYIRYKIMQVDKKTEATKLIICELRKKLDRVNKSRPEK